MMYIADNKQIVTVSSSYDVLIIDLFSLNYCYFDFLRFSLRVGSYLFI